MTRARLGSFIFEHNERNRMNRALPVYSVTNSRGFCQQYFNKVVASEDRSTYKIVPRNYFAYNPSRINVGSIDWQRYEESVIVSPLYVVFNTSDEMDNQFLCYYLKSDVALTYIRNLGQGSVRDNLKFAQLSEIPINVYSLEEQKFIAQRLDALSNLISLRQRQAEKLDELVKARFVEMFGECKYGGNPLSNVCKLITDGTHQPPQFVDAGIPFLLVSNLVHNEITYDTEKFISKESYQELIKRTPVEIGDILLSIVGSYGHAGVVRTDKPFCFQRHIAYIKPDFSKMNSEFLHQALLSDAVKYQMEKRVKGIAQKTLNLSELKKIVVPIPPLALQTEFSHFVHGVDREKERIQRSAALLETLKRSLMQQYFG